LGAYAGVDLGIRLSPEFGAYLGNRYQFVWLGGRDVGHLGHHVLGVEIGEGATGFFTAIEAGLGYGTGGLGPSVHLSLGYRWGAQ
jgi:hypothetical protein